MEKSIVREEIYLQPGYICLPKIPTKLCTVVGSGVVITIFDTRLKYGGMNYYIRPIRKTVSASTPVYACPAIIGLLNMLFRAGSKLDDLEAHLYGGARNPESEEYIDGLSEKNVKVGFEILETKNIHISGKDIGGDRGRKVMFNTSTGESVVAKVDKIRALDWYPEAGDIGIGSFDFDVRV